MVIALAVCAIQDEALWEALHTCTVAKHALPLSWKGHWNLSIIRWNLSIIRKFTPKKLQIIIVPVQMRWYPKYSSPTVNQAQTGHTPIWTLQLCVLLFSPFYQTLFQADIKSSALQLTNQFGSQRLSICRTCWPWGFETQQYRSKASLRTRSQPARMSWHQSPQRVVRLAERHHHSKVIKPNPWDTYQQYSEIFGMTRQQQAT